MTDSPLALVLPDIRSAQNVGAMLRTADAAGVALVVTCGYTPRRQQTEADARPPHVVAANARALAKTALGAEMTVPQRHFDTFAEAVSYLHKHNYNVIALEQAEGAADLFQQLPPGPVALVVGNEVTGLDPAALSLCDAATQLPMLGTKESLNVAVAAGIALYQLRFGR